MTPRSVRHARGSSVDALGELGPAVFELTSAATHAALLVADLEGRVLLWNAAAEEIFGWSAEEALGERARDLIVPLSAHDRSAEILASVVAGEEWRGEFTCRRRNGTLVPVSVVVLPVILESEVRGVVSIIEDRTALRDSELQRQAVQALSDASNDAVITVAGSTITSWNPAARELFGWRDADVVGRDVAMVVPLDLQDECALMLEALARGEGVQDYATVRLHRDGTRIPVRIEMTPVRDPVTDDWLGVATVRDDRDRDEALEAAREAERRIRAMMTNSNEVIALTDADGVVHSVSPSFANRGKEPSVVLGRMGREFIHPDDQPAVKAARELVLAHPDERPVVLFRDHLGDEWRWREVTFTNLLDDPAVASVVLNIRDVHDTVVAAIAAEASEARFAAIVQRSSDVAMLVTAEDRITWVSPAARAVFGLEPEHLIGMRGCDLVHPEDRAETEARLLALEPGEHVTLEFRVLGTDGSVRWVEEVATHLLDDPDVGFVVANLRDVTERHAAAEEALRTARTDTLTGLPNRSQLVDLIGPHLADGAEGCGVVFFDIDDFCDVNDALGHSVGDALLVGVAERVSRSLAGRPATLVRFGGDQFAVVCPGGDPILQCLETARIVRAAFSSPFPVAGNEVFAGASYGLAISPVEDVETLLRHADTALYRAKKAGRGRMVAFDPQQDDQSRRRMQYAGELRGAIDRHEIAVHYQPVVDLQTNQVIAVEALARWTHPELGTVPPDVFIPVAESTGLIGRLGRDVLSRACRDAARWAERGWRPQVGVNASAVQMVDPEFVWLVQGILADSGLSPTQLHLEITETTAMTDVAAVVQTIEALRDLGVSLSLDDFGTGYSSLSFLRRLPAAAVKIDRSFVDGLLDPVDDHDRQIVTGVVGIARALGLFIVAEGVESQEQADELRRLGCHFGQGFLWSPAVPESDLHAVVERIETRGT